MIIRAELPGDEDAIHELTETAFAPMAFSDGSEPRIVFSGPAPSGALIFAPAFQPE